MKNLYSKIHAVMMETKAIEKNMTISFKGTGYTAVSESAVLNEMKPLLKKHGLIIFPVSAEMSQQGNLTILRAGWKICDIESGECELLESPGIGSDMQDKGSGKAFTYAYKTLLQKTFMLFSGEDSDNDHSDELSDKEKVALVKLEELYGKMSEDVQNAILKGYKVRDVKDIPKNNWASAMKGMQGKLK